MKENLQTWMADNEPDETLIYGNGLSRQCVFVRDDLMLGLFFELCHPQKEMQALSFDKRTEVYDSFVPNVIGTHISKSVKLPVMEIDLTKFGVKIILRYNFYDWCLSVESVKDVECDFLDLITDKEGCFEGFPQNRIYEGYSENNKRNFSVVLNNKYQVFMFVYILKLWLERSKENG